MKIFKSKNKKYEVHIMNMEREQPQDFNTDFKMDESNVLSNPFNMSKEEKRDHVCKMYKKAFVKLIYHVLGYPVMYETHTVCKAKLWKEELDKLLKALKQYKKIRLYCWCAPKRCHTETIAHYLIKRINKEGE